MRGLTRSVASRTLNPDGFCDDQSLSTLSSRPSMAVEGSRCIDSSSTPLGNQFLRPALEWDRPHTGQVGPEGEGLIGILKAQSPEPSGGTIQVRGGDVRQSQWTVSTCATSATSANVARTNCRLSGKDGIDAIAESDEVGTTAAVIVRVDLGVCDEGTCAGPTRTVRNGSSRRGLGGGTSSVGPRMQRRRTSAKAAASSRQLNAALKSSDPVSQELPKSPHQIAHMFGYVNPFMLINQERTNEGFLVLKRCAILDREARLVADKMAKTQKVIRSEMNRLADVLEENGVEVTILGENSGWGKNLKEIHRKFMRGDVERGNILDKRFTDFGIGTGTCPSADGCTETLIFVCQLFKG